MGIDYSDAQTPTACLKGLRVYLVEGDAAPVEVLPPPSPRKYWTRRGVAEWLVEHPRRVVGEQLAVADVAGEHGVGGVPGLLPDLP